MAAQAWFRPVTDPLLRSPEQMEARAFGLHRFEDPGLAAPEARPIWTASTMPAVIRAEAESCQSGTEGFSLDGLASLASVATSSFAEHVLLTDGLSLVRIDVTGAAPSSGPVMLRYRLEGIVAARAAIPPLLAFLRVARKKAFQQRSPALSARRQILLLRAWDGLVAGASPRQIAASLLSPEAAENRWRVNHSSLRSRAQRLCKGARRMANGDFWQLLR